MTWDGFLCRGLDEFKLTALWALVETGDAEADLDESPGQIVTTPENDQGPWVDLLPPKMVESFALIAGWNDHQRFAAADALMQSGEFTNWAPADMLELLRRVGDLAATAQQDGVTLLLWTNL